MNYPPRPSAFVVLSTHQGTLIANKNDFRMIDAQRGYGVGWQLFSQGSFDPQEVDSAVQLLRLRRQHHGDGVVALDCGANLGVHTVEWARHMHGWGRVTAIEAQERIYYALAGNLAINNCFNASALHAALGANEGWLDIPVPDYFQPASFGSLELRQSAKSEFIGQHLSGQTQRVRMVSIDSLALARVDFLKIDIEGMELEALEGARRTIEAQHPVMLIESIKTDKARLLALLETWGYRTFPLGINILAVHASDPVLQHIQTSTQATE